MQQECGLAQFAIRQVEIVGPKAGADMRRQALLATLYALGGMLVYIAFRFEWIAGVAAVVAIIHDTLITLGFFSWFDREIKLTVIAALLTLIGYSMNDKIVVFDRVRENLKTMARMTLPELVNKSINQTLSRTMLTAGPTLLCTLALYFLGGPVLNGIASPCSSGSSSEPTRRYSLPARSWCSGRTSRKAGEGRPSPPRLERRGKDKYHV